MYRWELDGPAQQEFVGLNPAAQSSLAAFMDAVVIVDPDFAVWLGDPGLPPAFSGADDHAGVALTELAQAQ